MVSTRKTTKTAATVEDIISSMNRGILGGFTPKVVTTAAFPEKYHPRRYTLYQRWKCNTNTFFRLKASGVPTLTAYLVSNTMNMTKVQKLLNGSDPNRLSAIALLNE